MAEQQKSRDQDEHKGAVEDNGRTNTSMAGQNPHRTDNSAVKANDTDFPEPGSNPEHSGERTEVTRTGMKNSADDRGQGEPPAEGADVKAQRSPEREQVNQDPGQKQKQMHNDEKDDPLAA